MILRTARFLCWYTQKFALTRPLDTVAFIFLWTLKRALPAGSTAFTENQSDSLHSGAHPSGAFLHRRRENPQCPQRDFSMGKLRNCMRASFSWNAPNCSTNSVLLRQDKHLKNSSGFEQKVVIFCWEAALLRIWPGLHHSKYDPRFSPISKLIGREYLYLLGLGRCPRKRSEVHWSFHLWQFRQTTANILRTGMGSMRAVATPFREEHLAGAQPCSACFLVTFLGF